MTFELKLIGKKGNGMVCLVEKDAPTIYQLKPDETSDGVFELEDDLVHSIVLDGLYTKGTRRKQIKHPYRRKGRNIEVLVREPYHVKEFNGLNFHAVTFKGAGAIPEDTFRVRDYLINPLTWRGGDRISQFKRIWGGLDEGFAIGEADNKILSQKNIFHTPYTAKNRIPEIIQEEIYRKASPIIYGSTWDKKIHFREKQDSDPDLYQVVRFSMTNIRHSDFDEFDQYKLKDFASLSLEAGWTLEKWIEHLASVNGKLVKESLKLAGKGRFLQFNPRSDFADNTYITGEITDLEQVVIGDYDKGLVLCEHACWPASMIDQSVRFLIRICETLGYFSDDFLVSYQKQLSDASGQDFIMQGKEFEQYMKYHGFPIHVIFLQERYRRYRDIQIKKSNERKVLS